MIPLDLLFLFYKVPSILDQEQPAVIYTSLEALLFLVEQLEVFSEIPSFYAEDTSTQIVSK